jgi:tRNA-modifying protein YgfZ
MTLPHASVRSIAYAPHRGVLILRGPDAKGWLENLITNDLVVADPPVATLAALLSPQGKILFDLMITPVADHILIETRRTELAILAKRLALYKLRATVTIDDASHLSVYVGPADPLVSPTSAPRIVRDGRAMGLGTRIYVDGALTEAQDARMAYTAFRVAHGLPEAGIDYELGQTFPHEANFDLFHGVSFTKGCFIGQEVVARMQNKTVVRKRIVRVSGDTLETGAAITAGPAALGTVGTVAGRDALAMIRLDRAIDAIASGTAIIAGTTPVSIDPDALTTYRNAVKDRPQAPDF